MQTNAATAHTTSDPLTIAHTLLLLLVLALQWLQREDNVRDQKMTPPSDNVQQSQTMNPPFGIVGARLKEAPMKPPVHRGSMVPSGLSGVLNWATRGLSCSDER